MRYLAPTLSLLFLLGLLLMSTASAESLFFEQNGESQFRQLNDYHPSDEFPKFSEVGIAFRLTNDYRLDRAVFKIERRTSDVTMPLQAALYDTMAGTWPTSSRPNNANSPYKLSAIVAAADIPVCSPCGAGSPSQISFGFPTDAIILAGKTYGISVTSGTTGTIDAGYNVYLTVADSAEGNRFEYPGSGSYNFGSEDMFVNLYGDRHEVFTGTGSGNGNTGLDSSQDSGGGGGGLLAGGTSVILLAGAAAYLLFLRKGRSRIL